MNYILDKDRKPVKCDIEHRLSGTVENAGKQAAEIMRTWAEFMSDEKNIRVGLDSKDGVRVSTVFLGIDHNFEGKGEPILFKTMVFGGKYDEEQWRYSTWKEAEEGHRKVVREVLKGVKIF